ncbi:DUF6502 family protein [Ideonella sp. YS5]|uniref:DUF6502 family protein n=1 Tax=Ideonella sp. YS5 TaxID=3453714 RepID=UPI003F711B24
MDAPNRSQRILENAVATLLRPLFRVLLRQSMSFLAFEELAKRVFVDVAMKDFALQHKQPSISRAAILSGLTRKEVSRLLAVSGPGETVGGERYNRAARVLTGWLRDAAFIDANGMPRLLPEDGEKGFAELVRRYSGDVPARAVLDELVRVGAVLKRPDGRVELLSRAYVPSASIDEKLAILGSDVADLIDTIDHNIEAHGEAPRFQRKVMYHRIPASAVPGFRRVSAMQAQALLERMDRWLMDHDTGPEPGAPAPRAARLGLGIYYFEELFEPSGEAGEDTP